MRCESEKHIQNKRNGITIQQFKSKPLNGTQCACVMFGARYDFWLKRWREREKNIYLKKITTTQNEIIIRFFPRFKKKMDKSHPLNWPFNACSSFGSLFSRLPYRHWLSSPFRYLNSFKSHYEYYGHWIYANAINWCASVSVQPFITYLINAKIG